jgi:hypothetical protein
MHALTVRASRFGRVFMVTNKFVAGPPPTRKEEVRVESRAKDFDL